MRSGHCQRVYARRPDHRVPDQSYHLGHYRRVCIRRSTSPSGCSSSQVRIRRVNGSRVSLARVVVNEHDDPQLSLADHLFGYNCHSVSKTTKSCKHAKQALKRSLRLEPLHHVIHVIDISLGKNQMPDPQREDCACQCVVHEASAEGRHQRTPPCAQQGNRDCQKMPQPGPDTTITRNRSTHPPNPIEEYHH